MTAVIGSMQLQLQSQLLQELPQCWMTVHDNKIA